MYLYCPLRIAPQCACYIYISLTQKSAFTRFAFTFSGLRNHGYTEGETLYRNTITYLLLLVLFLILEV